VSFPVITDTPDEAARGSTGSVDVVRIVFRRFQELSWHVIALGRLISSVLTLNTSASGSKRKSLRRSDVDQNDVRP
jgi:hypothetical protein